MPAGSLRIRDRQRPASADLDRRQHRAARRRVALKGDGWCPFPHPPRWPRPPHGVHRLAGEFGPGIDDLRRRIDDAGRTPRRSTWYSANLDGGSPSDDDFNADAYLNGLEKLAKLGVTWVQCVAGRQFAHALEVIERFKALVIDAA